MKIPEIVKQNNKEYKFIKKCNDTTFLYQEIKYGYKKCFGRHELGLIKPTKLVYNIKPEKDKNF